MEVIIKFGDVEVHMLSRSFRFSEDDKSGVVE